MLYNRECSYCGEKYYVCKKCIGINSWKNICCSRECFRKLIEEDKEMIPSIINEVSNMKTVLRAGLNNNKTIDIIGYDLELGKFDCSDGSTKTFEDIKYFIVPKEEMEDVSKRLLKAIEEAPRVNRTTRRR